MSTSATVARRMHAAQHETDGEAAELIPTSPPEDPDDEYPSRNKRGAIGKKVSQQRTSPTSDARNNMIKYGSLLLLVGQMVGLVLLMRYSRTHSSGGELYLASTAVFMMEIMKLFLCLAVVFHQLGHSFSALRTEIYNNVWGAPFDMLKLCVPSLLYTIQNNLLYLALSNLDAATYQILYQLKILTTALFSATMLGRKFSAFKWASLVILTIGVVLVQCSGSSDSGADDENDDRNRLVGLVAVLSAACTSGFAGVYFEKILKGSEITLWIRNIQMGLPSLFIASATIYIHDSVDVTRKGFFVGYNSVVVAVITVQAVGGLIVAVVVKYADNVLKVFSSSLSILCSSLISALFFNFRPNMTFVCGACLVIFSTVLYSKPETKKARQLPHHTPMTPVKGVRKSSLVM